MVHPLIPSNTSKQDNQSESKSVEISSDDQARLLELVITTSLNSDSPKLRGSDPIPGGDTIDLHSLCSREALSNSFQRPMQNVGVGSRYTFGKVIGSGGVGTVYEGWDNQLERPIAIKVLHEQHLNKPSIVRRFLLEAFITSWLQHPGVVAVHEVGWSPENRPFFVMKIINGVTLEYKLRHRQNPESDFPELLDMFHQVCQSVAYAHSHGVIHRDLKPANIMVEAYGVVKVMDWGCARIQDNSLFASVINRIIAEHGSDLIDPEPSSEEINSTGTKLGMVFGTPSYLAPEQARGEVDRIVKQTDVFGLGSILCEILTGLPTYTGSDGLEIYSLASAADTRDAFARLDATHFSKDMIDLAKWCLAVDPEARPKDASEIVKVITAHWQSDQRRAERDMIRFFELSLDLFCFASLDGYFLRVNQNFTKVLGYSAEELTSHPFLDFVHPDDIDKTKFEMSKISLGMPTIQFLNRYKHAHGHYVWFEWNAQLDADERAIYAVAREVTRRIEEDHSRNPSD